MKNIILIITAGLLVLSNINVLADEIREAEVSSRQLMISKDGTGIIKLQQCELGDCENIIVKVTPATRGILNGVEMNLLQARKLAKPGFVGLVYTLGSKEALTIGFAK